MRRSLAPSQRPAPPAAAQFSIPAPALAQRQGEGQGGGNNGAVVRFSAVWCKTSGRKHKKWEDDAILEIRAPERTAVLRDVGGKELCRGVGLPKEALAALGPGGGISFGGKDVEVVDRLLKQERGQGTEEDASVGRQAEPTFTPVQAPRFHRPPVLHGGVFRPFSVPTKSGERQLPTPTGAPVPRPSTTPLFNPDRPDALILPRPPYGSNPDREGAASVVDVVLDPHVSSRLRPHQREGVTFLYRCVMGFGDDGCTGAILADEMGLGKTLQTIALLWTLLRQGPWGGRPVVRRVLILTPSSLVRNWQAEFTKWLGRERITVYLVDSGTKITEYIKQPLQSPVVIMSYEMFVRCFEDLSSHLSFDLLVCDEGHRLKNEKIKVSTMLAELEIERRVVLTGTPLQNDLREFFALVGVVNPNILGTLSSFIRRYEEPIVRSKQPEASEEEREEGELRLEELSVISGKFILRRTQAIISKYLPSKVECVVFCRPTRTQSRLYQRLLEGVDLNCALDQSCILASITQLRKVCNHPSTLEEDSKENVDPGSLFPHAVTEEEEETFEVQGSKLAVVSSILHTLRTIGKERIVLVSISTKVLDLLAELCNHYGYPFCRLDGSTPAAQRQSIVSNFNSPHGTDFVMLLSSKAGGTGLNLIGASRILLYDMDWNPANDVQAMARVWRDGQRRQVHVYRLCTAGTIEEKIFQRQVTKQGLGGSLVDKGGGRGSKQDQFHFTREELRDLFSFNGCAECDTHDLLDCDCLEEGGRGDGGAEGDRKKRTFVHEESARECQLGGDGGGGGRPGEAGGGGGGGGGGGRGGGSRGMMGDLLRWEHLLPRPELFADDACLTEAIQQGGGGRDVSFVFRNVQQGQHLDQR